MGMILIRGGGDLASGVALRLHRSGYPVIVTELPQPLAVRRPVSFAEAIYAGAIQVEGVLAQRADTVEMAFEMAKTGTIPVLVDPQASILPQGDFSALIDARLLKRLQETRLQPDLLLLGLGPGFTCGENCHAVVETQRGHFLGRVLWSGAARADTGQPEGDARRVIRAPADGLMSAYAHIGAHIEPGQIIAQVGGLPVMAPIKGVVRGLIHPDVHLTRGIKIGDIDPRDDPAYCYMVSDKALAVGGGVLEALLTRQIFPGRSP